MNNVIKYGGWLALLLVILLGAYVFNFQMASERARASEARQVATRELEQVRSEKLALEAEVAALKAAQAELIATAPAPESEVEAAPEAESVPAPEGEAMSIAPAPEAAQPEETGGGDRVANAQVAMLTDMMFKSLFDELQLDPETRGVVQDAIAAYMQTMQQESVAAMRAKNETSKAFHARMEVMKSGLREELSQTLTAEQVEAWDAYEPVADQALYERMVEGQLNMLSTGLSNENRVLASQVMAEELARELEAFELSEEIFSMDAHNDAQARALEASLGRLAETLDEEQFGHVQGFVDQATAMFEAMKGR
jgi:hypothetical protein